LSAVGWRPLAVTTNLSINFLRKPPPGDLIAEARLLKLGKKLAVGEVAIRADGGEDLVAHVTSTYSIPPVK
jgi:acyl-coenzyme A thioesterase PaaI-like protein